jgi:hypothetical protein
MQTETEEIRENDSPADWSNERNTKGVTVVWSNKLNQSVIVQDWWEWKN